MGLTVAMFFLSLSAAAISPSDVSTIVRTDKSAYDPGENISVTITLINPTNSSIDLYSGGSPPWDIRIATESGDEVYLRGMEAQMIVTKSINPNETMVFIHNITADFPAGFYLITAGAFDAPLNHVWIKINGTEGQNMIAYDTAIYGVVFISGTAVGIMGLFLFLKVKKKRKGFEGKNGR